MTYPRFAKCPCCGFRTLEENGAYQICLICWWQDDGDANQDANEDSGGPNYQYSLSHAQRNFAHHGHMYDEGRGIRAVEQPTAARLALMEYLRIICFEAARADVRQLAELLNEEDRQLKESYRNWK
jgi:hypothetical protein